MSGVRTPIPTSSGTAEGSRQCDRANFGVHLAADVRPVLYSTGSSGERALGCAPFSLQERQRYVRPTRERLKRCGILTAGDH